MNTDIEGFTIHFLSLLSVLCSIQMIASVTDTLKTTQHLKDGETIVSSGGSFELGFFSPESNSTRRYVGIWYKRISIQTVVWVANREVPLVNRSGFLEVIKPGIIVIRNDRNTIIWSSSSSRSVQNPVVQLLETGNLVVRDANEDLPEIIPWQSFDNPTDTCLTGMKMGRNFVTGQQAYLTSWKNYQDPAPGEYSYSYDNSGYPQFFLKRGSDPVFRTGPWNGKGFSGVSTMRLDPILSFQIVFNEEELYFLGSMITRFTLSPSGIGRSWTWDDHTRSWKIYLSLPADTCDRYGICGAYGSCDTRNYAVCGCLDKFSPRDPEKWAKGNWSSGCVRNIPLNCQSGDGFLKYSGYKLPDTRISSFNRSLSLEECEMVCLKNCSCTAYSSIDVRNGGSGCLLWFGDLVDMKVMHEAGQDIYVRVASSESASSNGQDGTKLEILVISSSLLIGSVMLGLWHLWRRKKNHSKLKKQGQIHDNDCTMELIKKDLELPQFDLSTIIKATNHFSNYNKLGEGGFSTVYKGILEEGQEIAVKRLSETSTLGFDDFKNEVVCIAKLQHRNLVKLLGCCTEGEQKMLIYEYMPNRSLDSFIFDQKMSKILDWPKRFHIIQGIARGLLYLHQDSRLRIIHRDLKVSNILLDADLNPKISDFGIARSFGGDETGDNTSRVVGTLGYMSPEYAVHGLFSVKSDVFSFGVVLLEIVSGKKNRGFVHHEHCHNLLGHVWKLYKEGRTVEIVDSHLGNSYCLSEILRSIHVGLLCVQQRPEDRPSMPSVVFMLGNGGQLLPEAKQPGFFLERNLVVTYNPPCTHASSSNDEGTITLLQAR